MSSVKYLNNSGLHTVSGSNAINKQTDSPGAKNGDHKFEVDKDPDIMKSRDSSGHAPSNYGKMLFDQNNLGSGQNPVEKIGVTANSSDLLNGNYPENPTITDATKTQWQNTKKLIRKSTNVNSISKNASNIIDRLNATVHLPPSSDSVEHSIVEYSKYYNRFKIANPNLSLQKGFAHVFFVRPSCNILTPSGDLTDSVKSSALFNYAIKNRPELVRELSAHGHKKDNDFMMTLSNYAISFSNNSEYIDTTAYGDTYTGYKVVFGKHNIESKSAGEFTVSFEDDRNLDIYQIDRMWVEYISGVYRGLFAPTKEDIYNKILDYTSAVYYIITAEDGESIIFWTKYYGVFPTNVPTEQYSWASGNILNGENIRLDITFRYSFKRDYDPEIIEEFNKNAGIEGRTNITYMPTFDKELNHVGATMVGSPFISEESSTDTKLYYKLRFLQPDKILR